MDQKLKNLLYKKEMLEYTMDKFAKAVTIHSDLIEAIKEKLKDKKISEYDKLKLEIELNNVSWETRHFVTNYKLNQRDYQHNLIPSIERIVTEEEKESIEFVDFRKKAKELAENEIYGKAVKLPEPKEHILVIENIKKELSNLQDLINSGIKKQSEEKDPYLKAKLEKEIFDTQQHIIALTKRLRSREEYYYEQFLPKFKEELAEAKANIEKYLKKGNQIVSEGIDVQLSFVLEKYDDHKNDDEDLWLFYTALRNRVDSVISELKKEPVKYKDYQYITE